GITDAVNGREQKIVSRTGSGTRSRPQGFQQWPQAGLFCRQPQGTGKTEVTQGGGKGDRGSILLDEFSEFFGGAEIGLMDDAGFTVDTRDRKSTRLNSSHVKISYAVFCLKKKKSD